MKFDLYYVAVFKHGCPQCLAAGPFIDWSAAKDAADLAEADSRNAHGVVRQEIEITGDSV
jgi:hypothetical protein